MACTDQAYTSNQTEHVTNALVWVAGVMTCFSIVEQGEQAYGKHVKKDNEEPVPNSLLKKFLRIQNGADVRGVVLDGVPRDLSKGGPVFRTQSQPVHESVGVPCSHGS